MPSLIHVTPLSVLDHVDFCWTKIAALDRIGMYDVKSFMHKDTGTSFFRVIVVFVLNSHLFLCVDGLQILKIYAIRLYHLPKELGLGLQGNLAKTIAVDKEVFGRRMSMEIKIK